MLQSTFACQTMFCEEGAKRSNIVRQTFEIRFRQMFKRLGASKNIA